jgi:GMP synthase (glutamine-hydrolysing)
MAMGQQQVQRPRILLLHNTPSREDVAIDYGTFETQVADALTAGGAGITAADVELVVVRTFEGPDELAKVPADAAATGFFCAIFSGSKFDVTMRLPWMLTLEEWIVRHAKRGFPMLGICFGHQLFATAFGGDARVNPRGCEVGSYTVRRVDGSAAAAAADPLVSQLPAEFSTLNIHAQSVEVLPEGAVAFYESDIDRNQLVRFAANCYGTQFHPEFTPALVQSIARYIPYGTQTEADQARIAAAEACPASTSIIAKFVKLYMPTATDKHEADAEA